MQLLNEIITIILLGTIIPINPTIRNSVCCPFEVGDKLSYSIDGKWEGKNNSIDFGKNTGTQSFIVIDKNSSHISIFETKFEEIIGLINATPFNPIINVYSFWVYDIKTRMATIGSIFSFLWISSCEKRIALNTNVNIMSETFQIVNSSQFLWMNQTRDIWIAQYSKVRNVSSFLLNEAYYTNIFEFHYDKQSGIMLFYSLAYNSYDENDNLLEWSYYSLSLLNMTIDINKYVNKNEFNPYFFAVFIGIIFPIFFFFTYKIYMKKRN